MSMALFCKTMQPALVSAQEHILHRNNGRGCVVALADDATFMAPPVVAFSAVDVFVAEAAKLGLSLNPAKSSTLCVNRDILPQATTLAKSHGFPTPVQCLNILGSFVGNKELEAQALAAHLSHDIVSSTQGDQRSAGEAYFAQIFSDQHLHFPHSHYASGCLSSNTPDTPQACA